MKKLSILLFVLLAALPVRAQEQVKTLKGNRFFTFNTVIRVNQIEVSRERNEGFDERDLNTPERVVAFREAVEAGLPGARITWAFSWRALNDQSDNYRRIREIVTGYHRKFNDEITFIPGAYFANAYNSTEQVNKDIHEALEIISEMVGNSYRPKSILAGFLSAKNQQYLAEVEDIHVCQGNIWSQYAIDNQDGDGSVCYPYYPSQEHFCKPAQSRKDFVDCVNLDGWTIDFLAGRREGFAGGFNSRMGVGPIETFGWFGKDKGIEEILHTTAIHFDDGFQRNGFGWITNCWEISLPQKTEWLTAWLKAMKQRWPDVKCITQGEFGLLWRDTYKKNSFDYTFQERGSGIGGSDKDKEIRWYMNKSFRLAVLKDLGTGKEEIIDFTPYTRTYSEPVSGSTRNWTLFGDINQKQTRPQDRPVSKSQLTDEQKKLIRKYYPEILK